MEEWSTRLVGNAFKYTWDLEYPPILPGKVYTPLEFQQMLFS